MKIYQNYDLSKLNTFGIVVNARFFIEVRNEKDLVELFVSPEFKNNERMFLGGGSNVLFTKDFDGMVILNKLKGIKILNKNSKDVIIRSMSGEIWHDLVIFAVNKGYWGIENLSLIPGTVGAAPMQNIGAYGTELRDVLENIETYQIETGAKRVFKNEECELGYRDSIFKNKLKGKYFIFAITLKLSKIERKNISYKILQEHLKKNKIKVKNPKDISDAVTHIRKSKLPDPTIISNAGSFFKNVFVEKEKLEELLKIYPNMPYFEKENKRNKRKNGSKASVLVKIPAGWLIEQCGPASPRHGGASGTSWKGYRIGNAGVHEKQALVLVNYGGATGKEVEDLAEQITASVFSKFGLKLVPEVNLI